ncbi:hypothetical protein AVEN_204279-1 [Araneus ventricosus]|uniref:Uncharacterized protein n=1 Tax=Araneus ventricosus TaxID=182803 RepID=A0A4Y2JPQ2_ARAVE|nr:hypothetical protein AVEN_204279-1 [Araneus ventricosus]
MLKRARQLSLVILMSSFEATRGLFWDGPRNFEPRSDDEDDTRADKPLSKLPLHTNGWTFGHYLWFSVQQALHGRSSLESGFEKGASAPKAEKLSIGYRCLNELGRGTYYIFSTANS